MGNVAGRCQRVIGGTKDGMEVFDREVQSHNDDLLASTKVGTSTPPKEVQMHTKAIQPPATTGLAESGTSPTSVKSNQMEIQANPQEAEITGGSGKEEEEPEVIYLPAPEAKVSEPGEAEVIYLPNPDIKTDEAKQQEQSVPAEAAVVAVAPATKKQPRAKQRAASDTASQSSQKSQSTAAGSTRKKQPKLDASCPSSRADADFERELKAVKKRLKEGKTGQAAVGGGAPVDLMNIGGFYNSSTSDGERDMRKHMFISFYREQYARIGNLDVSQYPEDNSLGLSIKDGHRPMPRPKDPFDVPPDHKQPLGNITPEQLKKYGCESKRMLICLHGDLFDVSDRPDKYSKDGPYWAMVGHDITWGLVCGNDDAITYDQYFDVFKVQPRDMAERKLQGLMSWWCFYEKEYGAPVGRLDLYNEEWKLPEPPEVGDVCCVM